MHNISTEYPTIMRLPEVMRVICLSRASIYRMVEAGSFPRQFKIGTAAVGWLRSEVQAWVSERANARPNTLSLNEAA